MHLIIAGLSKIGENLAELLSKEGHEVVVVDLEAAKCAQMAGCSDVMAITGDATKKSVLDEAGVRNADAVVAASGDDSDNLMISMLAKEMGARKLVSILSDATHTETFKQAGIGFQVKPDAVVAKHIYRMLVQPYVKDFLSFERAEILEIEVEQDMKCVGKRVAEIGAPNGTKILVVERGGKYLYEDAEIQPTDWLTLIVNRESAKKGAEFMDRWFTKG